MEVGHNGRFLPVNFIKMTDMEKKKRIVLSLAVLILVGTGCFLAGRASRYWDVRNAEDTVKCLGWGNDQLRIELDTLYRKIENLQDSISTLNHKKQ